MRYPSSSYLLMMLFFFSFLKKFRLLETLWKLTAVIGLSWPCYSGVHGVRRPVCCNDA